MEDNSKKIGLYKKISKVMASVDSIAKNGRNDFQHYDYTTEADVLAELRSAFINEGLIIIPAVSYAKDISVSDAGTYLTSIVMDFSIVDVETGERITVGMAGQGSDKGDKGVYKAITGATKYFLLKTFMIPTGDDPEKEDKRPVGRPVGSTKPQGNPEPVPWEQSEATTAVEKKLGITPQEAQDIEDSVNEAEAGEYPLTKVCETCGEPATFREGVSKTGKEWKAYFCSSDNREHAKFVT